VIFDSGVDPIAQSAARFQAHRVRRILEHIKVQFVARLAEDAPA